MANIGKSPTDRGSIPDRPADALGDGPYSAMENPYAGSLDGQGDIEVVSHLPVELTDGALPEELAERVRADGYVDPEEVNPEMDRRRFLGDLGKMAAAGLVAMTGVGHAADALAAARPTIYIPELTAKSIGNWAGNYGAEGLADIFEMRFPRELSRHTNQYDVSFEQPSLMNPHDFRGKCRIIVDTDKVNMVIGNLLIREKESGFPIGFEAKGPSIKNVTFNLAYHTADALNKHARRRNRPKRQARN